MQCKKGSKKFIKIELEHNLDYYSLVKSCNLASFSWWHLAPLLWYLDHSMTLTQLKTSSLSSTTQFNLHVPLHFFYLICLIFISFHFPQPALSFRILDALFCEPHLWSYDSYSSFKREHKHRFPHEGFHKSRPFFVISENFVFICNNSCEILSPFRIYFIYSLFKKHLNVSNCR